ncbi:MAG: YggT family protein [Treponema sp.]|nr:YggT family protein [Treponema sp.]
MRLIFGFLASAIGIYLLLLFIRIIISWFGGFVSGKPVELLARVTDPYLDWWRGKLNLRLGMLDFSAVAGIVFLSLAQNILYSLARSGRITIGYILALLLMSIWSIASFLLGICVVILVLRLIAYLTNRDIYSPFWKVIDSISQPLLYRLNRIFFGSRIENYLKGLVISIAALVAIWIAGGFVFPLLTGMLSGLPL